LNKLKNDKTNDDEKVMAHKKPSKKLPTNLESFRESYVELFGSMPPLPAARFDFGGETDPEALLLLEQFRAHAFYNKTFDLKTTQLLIFGMLLTLDAGVARHHAAAARKAGASWKELHTVAELVSVVKALGPANLGSSMLNDLKKAEDANQKN
jgi:4-carboxymuconolactone decarboxylase